MYIKYREARISKSNRIRLQQINQIIENYQSQGYVLTLRQLYYQLVSKDIIPNKVAEYAKISTLLKEGRMGGLVDWDAIEDRLRKPSQPASWDNPEQILNACIRQYRRNRMEDQTNYIEVWVEKDALSGVLKRVTEQYGIPIVVNRGYSSVTAMRDAHIRFEQALNSGADAIKVIYIGDFDPSGQDMIRDIYDRIGEFNESRDYGYEEAYDFEIIPIALTLEQIRQYNPPPNPAKITDPRAKDYITKYGPTSWEVDALPPEVLNTIVTEAINHIIDLDTFYEKKSAEQSDINKLQSLKAYL